MNYKVTIKESSRELNPKEKIMLKDTSDCIKLDSATQEGDLDIIPESYVVLEVHNDKADDKDYLNFVLMDTEGQKYVTGSQSFMNTVMNIWDGIEELKAGKYEFKLHIYRLPSKNYTGRDFITCSIR